MLTKVLSEHWRIILALGLPCIALGLVMAWMGPIVTDALGFIPNAILGAVTGTAYGKLCTVVIRQYIWERQKKWNEDDDV